MLVLAAICNGWDVYRGDQTDIIRTIATYLRWILLAVIRNSISHRVCVSDMWSEGNECLMLIYSCEKELYG